MGSGREVEGEAARVSLTTELSELSRSALFPALRVDPWVNFVVDRWAFEFEPPDAELEESWGRALEVESMGLLPVDLKCDFGIGRQVLDDCLLEAPIVAVPLLEFASASIVP